MLGIVQQYKSFYRDMKWMEIMDKKIRVVVIDDVEEVTRYFRNIISHENDMEVVGEAHSEKKAIAVIDRVKPDIVLTDIQMETRNTGISIIKYVSVNHKEIKSIVLTIHEEDGLLFQAYAEGAMDFIIKTSSIVDIIYSIRNVYLNKLSLKPEISEKIHKEFSKLKKQKNEVVSLLHLVAKLTNAEYEIMQAVYNGISYRQIAKTRFVEEVTVRTQVNRIIKKLGVKSMKEAVKQMKYLDIFDTYSLTL